MIEGDVKFCDPRGVRFGAFFTFLLLLVFLQSNYIALLYLQLIFFFIGGFISPLLTPYSLFFRKFIRKRLREKDVVPDAIEDVKFAQQIGFFFTLITLISLYSHLNLVAVIFLYGLLIASLLNFAVNICLGCYFKFKYKLMEFRLKRRLNSLGENS